MFTGEDGEKGLFAMQVRWFSVYLLKMCNTLYLKPLEHETICSSDDMGNLINHKILSIFINIDKFSFLFLNMNKVLENSTPGKVTYIL